MARQDDTKGSDHFTRIASTENVSTDDRSKLYEQIANLEAQLATERTKRSEAEKQALALAESDGTILQPEVEERPTGRTVTVQKYREYDDRGRRIAKPEWEDVEVPTYFYKINLAPNGGMDLKINGMPMYHGTVVELDLDTLRSVKEIVARGWKHEAEIRGSNENAYRGKYGNTATNKLRAW